jgi:hypothetical protein
MSEFLMILVFVLSAMATMYLLGYLLAKGV